MPITIPPYSGQIIMCDYSGFVVPEIVKRRPVVVISPKPRREHGLCAVVPLSTTPPRIVARHHVAITMPEGLVEAAGFQKECWAKCDLVNTVSLARLDLVRMGRGADGRRQYSYFRIDAQMLEEVRSAVIFSLTGRI